MSGLQTALAVTSGVTVLWTAMISVTLLGSLRRHRRRVETPLGRWRVRRALLEGDDAVISEVAERATREPGAQLALAAGAYGTVESLDGEPRARVHEIVRQAGLVKALAEQVRSMHAADRCRAALLIGELRLPGADERIAPLLHDPDPEVRQVACAELSRVGTDGAARSLLSALMTEELPDQDMVERLAGRWAVPSMVAVLEDPQLARSLSEIELSETWRTSVVGALGAAADTRAELTLARVLDSSRAEERAAAARALGPSGSEASIPVLIAALHDPDWEVRTAAARSISRHTDGYAARPLQALASLGGVSGQVQSRGRFRGRRRPAKAAHT
jgi:hypothetical protein